MGKPRFLCENLFNLMQFESHTIASNSETAGYEDWRVGTSRRSDLNRWTPAVTNTQSYVRVTCDRLRAANMIVVDRNSNLAGERVRLRVSDGKFTDYTEVFSVRIPTVSHYGAAVDEAPGALTEEGAWVYKFDTHIGNTWAFYVDAMGAGEKPYIGGLYLGLSFQPTRGPGLPWDDEARELAMEEIVSPSLWVASNRPAQRKAVTLQLRMDSTEEYDQARYHFHSLAWKGQKFWYVPDDAQAERAWLAYAPPGIHSAPFDGSWPYRTLGLTMYEHEPKPI